VYVFKQLVVGAPVSMMTSQNLPEGWTAYTDKNSRLFYYVHLPSGITQWRPPSSLLLNPPNKKRVYKPIRWYIVLLIACSIMYIVVMQGDQHQHKGSWSTNKVFGTSGKGNERSSRNSLKTGAAKHIELKILSSMENSDTQEGKYTITVYTIGKGKRKGKKGIFGTNFLQKYGSSFVQFQTKEYSSSEDKCNHDQGEEVQTEAGSCLLLGDPKSSPTAVEIVKTSCRYAHCKTMIIGDERCRHHLEDARSYYSNEQKRMGYLPLGMRPDTWSSLQEFQSKRDFSISPSSTRKYAFNAIFSASTSRDRNTLAKILMSNQTQTNTYIKIAKAWAPNVNSPSTEQVGTNEYIKVLLDSVFTLAPAGHNPECYRLYEAVESGSIPIIVDWMQRPTSSCNSLHHWHDSPIVILQKWDDLFPTIENLLEDMAALNQRQADLQQWYKNKMSIIVSEFENFMLNKSTST